MANKELRAAVEAAVIDAVTRLGPAGFSPDDIVGQFIDRPGASRSSLFRWVSAALKSGKPGRALAKKVRAKAAARAKRSADPAKAAAKEAVDRLPKPVTPAKIVGRPALDVFGKLQEIMQRVEKVAKHAENPETGGVRNARLLLQSCEGLRRCLDTGVRLAEALNSLQAIERFHDALMSEIEAESPELAERIVLRLGQVVARFGAG